jgi:uncharacterized phage protein gp47/JayE
MSATALPTFRQLYDAGRAEVQARDPRLTDWTEGSALDAVVGAGAVIADETLRGLVELFAAQFVDTATGANLDALAADRYGLGRKAATAAVGEVRFTRGGSAALVVIPAGTLVSAPTAAGARVRFRTTLEVELAEGSAAVSAPVRCEALGVEGNAEAGAIDLVDAPLAADPGLTVTNPARCAGGASAETDPQLRDRLRRFFTTVRRGTVAALEAGALNVPGVAFATVDEQFIDHEDGGYVGVYVGDPDGAGNAALAALVAAELERWRAAGVRVAVLPAERQELALAMELTISRGADQSALRGDVRAAVRAHLDGLGVGEPLRLSRVLAAALRTSPLALGARLLSHSADVSPTAPHRALRLTAAGLSLRFVEL